MLTSRSWGKIGNARLVDAAPAGATINNHYRGKQAMAQAQIQSDTVQYAGHGGDMIDAYVSRPAAPGRYPGVIVTCEAFGVVDHIRDIARRFAAQGYVAIAPDLYTREGAPSPDNMDEVIQKMFATPDSRAWGDLDAAAVYLKGQGNSNLSSPADSTLVGHLRWRHREAGDVPERE